jgi:dephospho-CoA kinase
MLAELGARVTDADVIARKLMQPGQAVYEDVVRSFGREILAGDGTIDRKKLADAAFGTLEHPKGRAQDLNRLVHPAVGRAQEQWMADTGKADREAIAVVEAALIFEAGLEKQFDRIVVVTCPLATRIRRWMSRTNVDEASVRRELERRMAAQWPEEKKIAAADFVIDNSGREAETETKVQELHARLKLESVQRAGSNPSRIESM